MIFLFLATIVVACGRYAYVGRSTHTDQLWTVKGVFHGPKEWFIDILKEEKKPIITTAFPLADDLLFNRESLEKPGMPKIVVLYALNYKSRYWFKVAAFGPSFSLVDSIKRNQDTVRIFMRARATIVVEWRPSRPHSPEGWVQKV